MDAFIFLAGVFFGCTLLYILLEVQRKLNLIKLKNSYNLAFSEIKSLIGTKSLKFVSRFNDFITFKANGSTLGKVTVIIDQKKSEVSIFREDIVIYTHHYADITLIKSLIESIYKEYNTQIRDCYRVMGNIIDKATIQKMNPGLDFPDAFPKKSEVSNLTIDFILDRINEVGLNNLTKEEKEFLDNFQKK